jgi:cell division septal protein FtsQ
MMNIAEKYKNDDAIFIKFNRQMRRVVAIVKILAIVISITFSSLVIHHKYTNISKMIFTVENLKNNIMEQVYSFQNGKYKNIDIQASGGVYLSNEYIKQVANYSRSFAIKNKKSIINTIKKNISDIPFVKYVTVQKLSKSSINIKIQERQVIAQMKDVFSGKTYIIDLNGKESYCEQCAKIRYDIPIISDCSVDDFEFFNSLIQTLSSQCKEIITNAKQYINISSRRWDVVLKNDIKIMLPANPSHQEITDICLIAKEKLKIFDESTQPSIEYIDARINEKIYYRPK